jgi:cytidylate kinase
MIRVITIEREYGSGASDIAWQLAQVLNWKLWDQLLTNEIARLMKCSRSAVEEREERKDALHYRLLKGFMLGSFEGTLNAPRLNLLDADHILTMTRALVNAAAERGNAVIVGRGSAYHLQNRSDAFHLFLYAPFEDRVRRLEATGKSESEAIDLVETVDRDRSEYIKQYFNIEWPARHFFHLMINTKVGDQIVVETVLHSIALFDKSVDALKPIRHDHR